MIRLRRLLWITSGASDASVWVDAARQEPPVSGEPKACEECPLRRGGEWEEGAQAALADMSPTELVLVSGRWGCHEGDKPCAGMRRLIKKAKDE